MILSIYFLPILIASVDRYIIDFSIGPFVLLYSVLATIIMVGVINWGLASILGSFLNLISSTILALILGVLLINYFMFITYLFGVMDYQMM